MECRDNWDYAGWLTKRQPVIITPPQPDNATSPMPIESTCKIEDLGEKVDASTLELQRLEREQATTRDQEAEDIVASTETGEILQNLERRRLG